MMKLTKVCTYGINKRVAPAIIFWTSNGALFACSSRVRGNEIRGRQQSEVSNEILILILGIYCRKHELQRKRSTNVSKTNGTGTNK
jgi:hypothetical protein